MLPQGFLLKPKNLTDAEIFFRLFSLILCTMNGFAHSFGESNEKIEFFKLNGLDQHQQRLSAIGHSRLNSGKPG